MKTEIKIDGTDKAVQDVSKELSEVIQEVDTLKKDMEDLGDVGVTPDAVTEAVHEDVKKAVEERQSVKEELEKSFDTLDPETDSIEIEHVEDIKKAERIQKLKDVEAKVKNGVKTFVETSKPMVEQAAKDVKDFVDENAPKVKDEFKLFTEKSKEKAAKVNEYLKNIKKAPEDCFEDEDLGDDEIDSMMKHVFSDAKTVADAESDGLCKAKDEVTGDEAKHSKGCEKGINGACPLGNDCHSCKPFECEDPLDCDYSNCDNNCSECDMANRCPMSDVSDGKLEDMIERVGHSIIKHKKTIATCVVGVGVVVSIVAMPKIFRKGIL